MQTIMTNTLVRDLEARTIKFCAHADEDRVSVIFINISQWLQKIKWQIRLLN